MHAHSTTGCQERRTKPRIPCFVGEPCETDFDFEVDVTFEDGHSWLVTGDGVHIAAESITELPAAELGRRARALHRLCDWLTALAYANHLVNHGVDSPSVYAEQCSWGDLYRQHAGTHPLIDQALAVLARGYEPRRRERPQPTPEPGYIYVVRGPEGQYKVGRSKDVPSRIKNFVSLKLPFEVTLVHEIASRDMVWAEQDLHARFAACRTNGEWFALSPAQLDELRAVRRLDPTGGAQ